MSKMKEPWASRIGERVGAKKKKKCIRCGSCLPFIYLLRK